MKIYAVDPEKGDSVDSACIKALDSTGKQIKWSHCAKVNVRGEVVFPAVAIAPGEQIAGQARNTCTSNGLWDWAAYIQTSN